MEIGKKSHDKMKNLAILSVTLECKYCPCRGRELIRKDFENNF